LRSLPREIRQAARRLAHAPALSVAVVLCAALGIGGLGAAFGVIDAVLLRPLPYPDPDRLVMVWERALDGTAERAVASYPNFADWRAESRSFARLAAFSVWFPSVTGTDRPEKLLGALVSADFFAALGARPLLGRTFAPAEDRPGRGDVVLLGEAFWRRRFGADPRLLGQTVELDGREYTVIGVMPAGFQHPEPLYLKERTALWRPLAGDAGRLPRGQRFLRVLGRLRPGVGVARARADLAGVARRLEREHPAEDRGMGVEVVPLHEQVVGDVRPALLLLFAAAGLVLLIACADIAGLLLAGATGRARETAVRAALGAGRGRLAGQALLDSLLLALAGGALGLAAGAWGARALLALSPRAVPRLAEVAVDGRVLAFTFATCAAAALLFGAAPALAAAASDPGAALREGGERAGGRRGGRLLAALVALEVALALPLLVGAGLLAKSLAALERAPLGLSAERVLTLRLDLPAAHYPGAAELRGFYDRLARRVAGLPGVVAAGTTSSLPLSGLYDLSLEAAIDGSERTPTVGYRAVSPGYFAALGIPLAAGRPLGDRDDAGAPPVALVNAAMARAAWPGEDPVGRSLTLALGAGGPVRREVVGVVGDVAHDGPAAAPRPEVYVPCAQAPLRFATLAVRTRGEPRAAAGALRAALREIDRDLVAADLRPMAGLLADSLAAPRFARLLAALLAAVALALAALGLYGVTAYAAGRRTRETGIRAALGARRGELLAGVLRRGLAPVAAGLAPGLAASFLLARLLRGLLHGVAATDPATFVAAPLFLLVVSLLAAWLPARRAARIDPMAALRAE
jgi:putative ABC transport system permease protein